MDAISCNTSISATSQNYSDSGSDSGNSLSLSLSPSLLPFLPLSPPTLSFVYFIIIFSHPSDSPVDTPDTPHRQISGPSHSGSIPTPTRENPRPVHEVVNRASISTDSDSSPYTSGVPIAVDTKREAENGWQESDQSLVSASLPSSSKPLDGTYLPFHRPVSRESGNYGDTEEEDFTMSLPAGRAYNSSLSQPEPDIDLMFESMDNTLKRLRKSEDLTPLDKIVLTPPPPRCITPQDTYVRMNKEYDGAQEIITSMIFSLQEPSPPREPKGVKSQLAEDDEEEYDAVEDEENYLKYTGGANEVGGVRKRHNSVHPTSERLSNTASLSFSEPDLVAASVKPLRNRNSIDKTSNPPRDVGGASERPSGGEDELLTSLPATIARKFADPSPTHLQAPSPRRIGRFSLGFHRKKTSDKQSRNKSLSAANQLHPSSSLYFMSPEPQRKSLTSPARGLGGLFKKKEKAKLNKSMSSNFTDGGSSVPDTPKRVARVRRNTSLGPTSRLPPRYVNIDDIISSKGEEKEREGKGRERE